MLIQGIKSIKMGDCGADGAMGITLDTVFENIVNDTCTVELPKASVTSITPDDKPNPIAILLDDSSVQKKIMFSTYNASPEMMAVLFGGTVAGNKWSAPTSMALKQQSVELVSKDIDGFHDVMTAPKCAIVAGYTGKHNKKGLSEIAVEMYILTPKDATGTDLSPVQKEKVPAV